MTLRAFASGVAVVFVAAGCRGAGGAGNVVEIVAQGLTFHAPETIPSGWTTFRFRNESKLTHFALVERMPEGVGVAEQQEQVAPLFQQGMDLLSAGRVDAAVKKFGDLPAWFHDVVFLGGPGLTAPGHTSQASVNLEPGTYLLECYVKTNGIFHSYNPESGTLGMVHEFIVTSAVSAAPEPRATVTLTLSSTGGIAVVGTPTAGENTVAVQFSDQKAHENFVGHDVHVVRLTEDTDVDALVAWMDWSRTDGLTTPAPAEFLGGLNEMPAGQMGYFTVRLDPGRYAWIAEVPNASEKRMFVAFSVPG